MLGVSGVYSVEVALTIVHVLSDPVYWLLSVDSPMPVFPRIAMMKLLYVTSVPVHVGGFVLPAVLSPESLDFVCFERAVDVLVDRVIMKPLDDSVAFTSDTS